MQTGTRFFWSALIGAPVLAVAAATLCLAHVSLHWPSAAAATIVLLPLLVGAYLAGEKWKNKKTRQITELSALKEKLLAPASLKDKLDLITEGLIRILDADLARIWVVRAGDICDTACAHRSICEHRESCLHLVSSSGRYTHLNGPHQRVPLGCFEIGSIAAGNLSPLVTNDVQNDPRIRDRQWARTIGLRSFAGLRILNPAQQSAGVLAMFSKHPISPSEQALLEDLASTAAHVIVSNAAADSLREAYASLEAGVQQRTRELAFANTALKAEIEQRTLAEHKLRQSHAESESLLRSLSSFLIAIDSTLCIRRWNAAATATFGVSEDDVLGRSASECDLGWDWNVIHAHLSQAASTRQTVRIPELPVARPSDRTRVVTVAIDAIADEDDRIAQYTIVGTDITEFKNLQAQLVHAQKLESIGQLAAGIAHEINTPIQYVGDNLEFLRTTFATLQTFVDELTALVTVGNGSDARVCALRDRLDLDFVLSEIPRAVEQSLEGVSRVAHIVRAMKEFSHPGSAEKSHTDINRAIENTVTVARNQWKYVADLDLRLDPALPPYPVSRESSIRPY